jgi:AraC-like DNA-binding protein
MESERPFLDSGFKTETLCAKFDISYTKLKELLNEHLNEQSFSNYVNSYRVNYAKVILADPEKNHYSIEGIALESGFGTRQSFYKVFEQQTGLKPNYFRENIQKKKLVS